MLRGFAHKFDTIQDAFMHKTSLAKMTIPYDDPKYRGTANVFSFAIRPSTSTEFADTDCDMDTDTANADTVEDCFGDYLQRALGCRVPWDIGSNSSIVLDSILEQHKLLYF